MEEGLAGIGAWLSVIGFGIWLLVHLVILTVIIALIVLVVAMGVLAVAAIPASIVWLFIQAFKKMQQEEFDRRISLVLPILTALSGISISFCLTPGFVNPLALASVFATSAPLASILIYPPINRRRLIAKYRQGEQHLIRP